VDGARFLRAHGVPELVVSLVAYHTGAVFEAEQRGLADELAAFAEPSSELLDVVTFADLTTGPDGAEMSVTQRLSEILVRYPEDSPVHRAVTASSPSLLAGADRVAEHLVVDPATVPANECNGGQVQIAEVGAVPIRPENRDRYPANWPEISRHIRFVRAGGGASAAASAAAAPTSAPPQSFLGARTVTASATTPDAPLWSSPPRT